MTADVTISCPHCGRQYPMKIDRDRLQRLKTRATCGRCGKTFDAASRIQPAHHQPDTEPTLTPVAAIPPRVGELQAKLKPASTNPTPPDLRDEMEELAREFAEAASRFTPVGLKRATVAGGSLSSAAPPPSRVVAAEEPTNPGVTPASLATAEADESATTRFGAATLAVPPTDAAPTAAVAAPTTDVAAAWSPPPPHDQLSLEAEPATDEEFVAATPTLARRPAAARSWLEVADPGLASLQSPPAAGAAALEALLNESETIALPPPPAAS